MTTTRNEQKEGNVSKTHPRRLERREESAPTLASLRKLAKRKGFNPLEVELFENLAHGWTASTDSREDLSVRVFAVTEDKAARTFELCLSALPDVVPTKRGHHA